MDDRKKLKSFKSMKINKRASRLLDVLMYNSTAKRLFTEHLDEYFYEYSSYYLKMKLLTINRKLDF